MAWILLTSGVASLLVAMHAHFTPMRSPALALYSFVLSFVTVEPAPQRLLLEVGWVLFLSSAGGLETWPGQLGALLFGISWLMMGEMILRSYMTRWTVEHELVAASDKLGAPLPPVRPERLERPDRALLRMIFPLPLRPSTVERLRDIVFHHVDGVDLDLDIYRRRDGKVEGASVEGRGAPVLLYVHGGGWIKGSKNEQGLPLLYHMAARGWVCATVNYRLSPKATFPDHLLDVKSGLRWVREHIADYGGDPDFIAVAGGSAGGHLAALLALSANDSRYQPGFEDLDTRVQACVSAYGIYDLTNRHQQWPHKGMQRLLRYKVMKVGIDEAPEAYEAASPISLAGPEVPPFFLVHGKLDTLVPVAETRHFAERLRKVSRAPVVSIELEGTHHAFMVLPSLRTYAVVVGIERFLNTIHRRHLEGTSVVSR